MANENNLENFIILKILKFIVIICFLICCIYFSILCLKNHDNNRHSNTNLNNLINDLPINVNKSKTSSVTTIETVNKRPTKSIRLTNSIQENNDYENDNAYLLKSKSNNFNNDKNNCNFHLAFTIIDHSNNEQNLLSTSKLMLKFSNTLKSILININSTAYTDGNDGVLCIHLITTNRLYSNLQQTIVNVHDELQRQLTNVPYQWLKTLNVNGQNSFDDFSSFINVVKHRPLTKYFFIDSAAIDQRLEYLLPTLRKYFTHKLHSYYSNSLFFYSMFLHRVIPSKIADRLILLDIDVQLDGNILDLYEEFGRFKPEEVIGIAYEQQPVYRHTLHEYRQSNPNTKIGSPPNKNGFPGYNSGVVLLHLRKMRESKVYNSLLNENVIKHICGKYRFNGHLGDQDFYTITAIDHRSLYHTLSCGWNRQLCQWWRFHGYANVFNDYHQCNQPIMLYHGNCNSALPTLTYSYGSYRKR